MNLSWIASYLQSILGVLDGTEIQLMRHQRTQEVYQGRPEIDRRLDTEGTRRNGFTPAPKKNLTTEMMTKTGKAEVQAHQLLTSR